MGKAIIQNEFAVGEVSRDESANGVRLFIRDLATDNRIYLDPLELEALTCLDYSCFILLVATIDAGASASGRPRRLMGARICEPLNLSI